MHICEVQGENLFGFLFGGFPLQSNLESYLWPKLHNLNRYSFENVVCGYASSSPLLRMGMHQIKHKAFMRTLNIKITFSSEMWAVEISGSIWRKLRERKSVFFWGGHQNVSQMRPSVTYIQVHFAMILSIFLFEFLSLAFVEWRRKMYL